MDGDITLTIADGSERFLMLDTEEPMEIKSNEVVYRDDKEVLCPAWNYRECEKTKLTEKTKNVSLIIEGLEHTSKEEIMSALLDLESLVQKYCGGTFQKIILDNSKPEASI